MVNLQTEETNNKSDVPFIGKSMARIRSLHPWLHKTWPPLNGQRFRQTLFRSLIRELQPQAVFESGTHRGTTTEFLWNVSGCPVWTVEKDSRLARQAARKFREVPDIRVVKSDSRRALRELRGTSSFPRSRVLFYLDAHWDADLPLREEVDIITSSWTNSVIVIDDFKVPDDPGYGFDVYGRTELSIKYVGDAITPYQVFWPECPSHQETGARRGCVLLAAPEAAPYVAGLPEVRGVPESVAT
ncbi:hypothetical protein [Streptomyces sp. MK7]|uniref:hypothetical protein n=1 Tax=Streptomyces sp. MK7 TaxID=3067635 RepID=UPI00292E2056|nr:hypothetical protein [Streptomyces sp. MK7]